jgi:hypothetical protein
MRNELSFCFKASDDAVARRLPNASQPTGSKVEEGNNN